MTCIVGLVDGGIVYMGADSAGVSSYDLTVRKDTKLFKNGDFLIGYTSSFRMGQLLRFNFSPPKKDEDKDVYEYMATDFIDAVRVCFNKGGFARIENGVEEGGCFLVGYKGRLFKVESDYQVGESHHGFCSAGCGDNFAIGSLFSTQCKKPKDRIKTALECAQEFSIGVRGPFVEMVI